MDLHLAVTLLAVLTAIEGVASIRWMLRTDKRLDALEAPRVPVSFDDAPDPLAPPKESTSG